MSKLSDAPVKFSGAPVYFSGALIKCIGAPLNLPVHFKSCSITRVYHETIRRARRYSHGQALNVEHVFEYYTERRASVRA